MIISDNESFIIWLNQFFSRVFFDLLTTVDFLFVECLCPCPLSLLNIIKGNCVCVCVCEREQCFWL